MEVKNETKTMLVYTLFCFINYLYNYLLIMNTRFQTYKIHLFKFVKMNTHKINKNKEIGTFKWNIRQANMFAFRKISMLYFSISKRRQQQATDCKRKRENFSSLLFKHNQIEIFFYYAIIVFH